MTRAGPSSSANRRTGCGSGSSPWPRPSPCSSGTSGSCAASGGSPMSYDGADVAVRVQDVGKRYTLYARPQDRLKQAFARGRRQYFKPVWALRNVSFEVRRGESLGIVGRNGSGKTTLLQIIAGTMTPTEGEVHVRGRLAALLELGSGF